MIPVIWGRQTEDEQELRKTTDLNSIGFSKADASFFSHMKLGQLPPPEGGGLLVIARATVD